MSTARSLPTPWIPQTPTRTWWVRLLSVLPGELGDRALVRVSLDGGAEGQQAYAVLVRRHQAWLVRYLAYLLHDAVLAEDLAQEVFVRAYLRLKQLKGESFKAWLRRIATTQAFNHHRDRKTAQRYEDAAASLSELLEGPDESVETREALLLVLNKLPYATREILVLRFVENLGVRDIARTLDLGESAAKMRLKRAREDFAQRWNEEVGHASPAPATD